MKFIDVVMFIIFIIIIGLVIFIHYDKIDAYIDYKFKNIEVEISKDIVENCEDKDLHGTTLCLRNNIDEIYKFNISNVGIELSFEELKEQGGVCTHYSILYIESARSLGYAADYHIIDMRNKSSDHMMATISDETGYCLVDQIMPPICVTIK